MSMTIDEKFEVLLDRYFDDYMIVDDPKEKGSLIPFMERNGNYVNVGDGSINMAELLTVLILIKRNKYEYMTSKNVKIEDVLLSVDRLFKSAKEWGESLGCPMRLERAENTGFFVRDDLSLDDDRLKKMGIVSMMSNWQMLHTLENEDPCHSPFVSQDQVWNLSAPLMWIMMNSGNDKEFTLASAIGRTMNMFIKSNGYKVYNPYLSALKHYFEYCPNLHMAFGDRQEDRYDHFKMSVKVKRGANNWYYSGGTSHAEKVFGENMRMNKNFREWIQSLVFLLLDGPVDWIYRLFGSSFKLNPVYCYGYLGCWFGLDPMSSLSNLENRLVKRFNKLMYQGEAFEWNVLSLIGNNAMKKLDIDIMNDWLEDYEIKDHMTTLVHNPADYLCVYMIFRLAQRLIYGNKEKIQ